MPNPNSRGFLTECAREGFQGNDNPHLYSSPAWYAHAFGRYMHSSGRTVPTDVRMGRGYSIRSGDMRFTIQHLDDQKVSFERVL